MPGIDFPTTRSYLNDFRFGDLFIEALGWSRPAGLRPLALAVEDDSFTLKPIAQLAGIVVFEVLSASGALPNAKARAAVHKEAAKSFYENLLIFLDRARSQSLWYWVKRDGKRAAPREHLYLRGQPGDLFLGKLSAMFVDISEFDEAGNINVLQVAGRLQKALDVERVTKKFFNEFAAQRLEFIELIQGIPDEHERRWYASVLLNRLMFVYFLQRKGFVDYGRLEYLQEQLTASRQRGPDRYYSEFLRLLFFEGFAKPEEKRSEPAKKLLGQIRYLNGGLFLPHRVELKYSISIPDRAFENLFRLFAGYTWNLDDTPSGQDNEINPDVLGYIFEKYINQKAFGAYYTRSEITEYLCERTIYRLILQKINAAGLPGVLAARQFESVPELLMNLDAGLCREVLDALSKLSLLDPACGSGAFLVAAMKTLINLYSAVIGRMEFLGDPRQQQWLQKTRAEHPSLAYYIKRQIITNNLFGVDIMEEAVEIARLRLFLALVASAQTVEQLEPLPNIDFNILPGNSLVGLLRVDEDEFDRRNPPNMFQKSYRQLVEDKRRQLQVYRSTTRFSEDLQFLRDEIERNRQQAQRALNDLLLNEFSRLGIKYEQASWDEQQQAEGKPKKRAVQLPEVEALRPFHWGYEFDQMMNARGGFDGIITNPPWEIFKPIAKEFCYAYDIEVQRRGTDIKDFEARLSELLQNPQIRRAYLDYLSQFPHVSAYYRQADQFKNQISVIDGKKSGTDINLYKLFVEQCFNLLRPGGECGIVVPSGIYSDLGTRQLREMLFEQAQITGLFCFENRKFIFEGVDMRFKFVVLTFEKDGKTQSFPAAFMRHDVNELNAFPQPDTLQISTAVIRRLSPDSLSVMEFKSPLDIQIAEKMLQWPFLGEQINGKWQLLLSTDLHMTNDSNLFHASPPPDSLPLYEGKMIWHFEHGLVEPRYWVKAADAREKFLSPRMKNIRKLLSAAGLPEQVNERKIQLGYSAYRLGFRAVTGATNERALVVSVIPKNVVAGNSLIVSMPFTDDIQNNVWVPRSNYSAEELLFCAAIMASFTNDWFIRQKILTNMNMFYVYQLPVPRLTSADPAFAPIVQRAARLVCTTPAFDELAQAAGLGSHKDGAADPLERARLRAELDGLVAHLYNLTEEEFTHILNTFPLVAEPVKAAALAAYRTVAGGPPPPL